MISKLTFILFFISVASLVRAQTPPTVPDPNGEVPPAQTAPIVPHPDAPAGSEQHKGVEELLDGSGLVINKNIFSYDGNEGRDPFKIYREYIQPTTVTGTSGSGGSTGTSIQSTTKNIRSVVVPDDVVVQGILYKKKDPIALVMIKGVKGLNKLKLNSPIGRNDGKVIDIQPDKVIVEQVKDFDGQKFTEKVILEIRAKKN
tara:strand:+ start:14410 stop:15012 length:603 start_codon:yes stop_codon:yes gene_type:complete